MWRTLYFFLRILGFLLVTWLLSSFEDTDSEIQVITSVIISAVEIQRFCVVLMLRTGVQWGNTCRWMVLCYAEKDGLHVVAYYEHWSVNEVYKKQLFILGATGNPPKKHEVKFSTSS